MFKQIDADDQDIEPYEIESVCTNCEENGSTRMMLTKIPFYKEVVLISFECPHCGFRNNEVQSGGKVQEQGLRIRLKVANEKDLNRQVIKSEFAGVSIPEISLEIPHGSQTAEITTIEGILQRTKAALEQDQDRRKTLTPDDAAKVESFLVMLSDLTSSKTNFTLIIDDPSGNSHVEPLFPNQPDPALTRIHYPRTVAHDKALGLLPDDYNENEESMAEGVEAEERTEHLGMDMGSSPPQKRFKNEVLNFAVDCPECGAQTQSHMKLLDIPNFKEVIIMAANCDACGYRSADIQSGGSIEPQGVKLTLQIETVEDLKRDVLKSHNCAVEIPELELQGGMGAMSGRFTTVEGLLMAMKEQLDERACFSFGDSAPVPIRDKMRTVVDRLENAATGKQPLTLVLNDSAGNSYVQSLAGAKPDSRLTVEFYERSFEQNEELGLNDIKTETDA